MAVPDYFARNAVAIAQAISGLDEERLSEALKHVCIGITLGRDSARKEGRALVDLMVRLLARLYPALAFRGDSNPDLVSYARNLAARINPRVDLDGTPTAEIIVGTTRKRPWAAQRFFVGSNAWTASISDSETQTCGDTDIPFGAGAAACLAVGNLFRHIFLPSVPLDLHVSMDLLDWPGRSGAKPPLVPRRAVDLVLAGCGAIGNAAAWALSRANLNGTITIVDHQVIDLGNLQRYVLAERSDESAKKPVVAARYFTGSLRAIPFDRNLASFLEEKEHHVEQLLLALDSAHDRRAAQASLPRWVANAWTQPGDLGVSTHDFLNGACVTCLYLPERQLQNEDTIIADAFGVPSRAMEIRLLLHRNEGAPRNLLEAIAVARDIPLDRLLPFEGKSVRSLYSDGFCGGAALPLSRVGTPRADVHVPLAHQSALAGILLAAAVVRHELGVLNGSRVTQLDVLKPVPAEYSRPVAKDPRGICICQDPVYREVYESKFAKSQANAGHNRSLNRGRRDNREPQA